MAGIVALASGLVAQNHAGPSPVEIRANPVDGLNYVRIQPGTFQMGCSDGDNECTPQEKPAHRITLTKSFCIGQTETTVAAYKRFVRATGRTMLPEPAYSSRSKATFGFNPGWREDQQPMVNVDWNEAVAYCSWAEGRLPTEAEWEYAARAGETRARYGNLDDIAWYAENSGRSPLNTPAIRAKGGNIREITPLLAPNENRPHSVGRKAPNRWGLFDVLGNAHEWVEDWWGEYQPGPATDPKGPPAGVKRVVRGSDFGAAPWLVRLSVRSSDIPTHGDAANGFRCVLDN